MAPSSPVTTPCATHSGSTHSSATLIAPGRKAVSRTPTDVSAASFLGKPTCATTHPTKSTPSLADVTQRHENALASRHPPNYSPATCCTSNVNPPPHFRGDDSKNIGGDDSKNMGGDDNKNMDGDDNKNIGGDD